MGFRFKKSIKVGKNTRINLSKSGIGVSSGVKGARVSVNQKGTRTTLTAPGTGISHVSYKSHGTNKTNSSISSSDNIPLSKDELMPKAKAAGIGFPIFAGILTLLSLSIGFGAVVFWGVIALIALGNAKSDKNQAKIKYNKALKETDNKIKIDLLKEAKELDEESNLINNGLAVSYYGINDYKNTLKYIDKIEDIGDVNLSNVLNMFLTSAFQEEEYQKIIDSIEPIMEEDLMLQLAVALAYKELGQVKKASEILAAGPVRKRTYDDTVLTYKYYLGLYYLEMGEKSKALTQLKKVYEIDSDFMEITQFAKDLGFALGEHTEE